SPILWPIQRRDQLLPRGDVPVRQVGDILVVFLLDRRLPDWFGGFFLIRLAFALCGLARAGGFVLRLALLATATPACLPPVSGGPAFARFGARFGRRPGLAGRDRCGLGGFRLGRGAFARLDSRCLCRFGFAGLPSAASPATPTPAFLLRGFLGC